MGLADTPLVGAGSLETTHSQARREGLGRYGVGSSEALALRRFELGCPNLF